MCKAIFEAKARKDSAAALLRLGFFLSRVTFNLYIKLEHAHIDSLSCKKIPAHAVRKFNSGSETWRLKIEVRLFTGKQVLLKPASL